MDFKPVDKNIKDLFSSKRQFMIPRFQREYSWDKKNYSEFFKDILEGVMVEDGKTFTSPYFVGTMLFVGNFTDNQKTEIQVVDGQQRLTTITILFSAMSDTFIDAGEDKLSEILFSYIMTTDDNGEQVRILKTKTSYPFFSFYIQERKKGNADDPISEEEKNIKETYTYFKEGLKEKNLRSFFKKYRDIDIDVEGISYLDLLKTIRDQVLGCTFVSISTDDQKQAYRIFEILNAKGKHLQYIDLIKNKIFEVLDKQEPGDYAEEKWKQIKKSLAITDVSSVGLATYFRHFWASSYKSSGADMMYKDFQKLVKPAKEERYKEFLNEMLLNTKYYTRILSPDRKDYDNKQQYYWLVQSLEVLSNYFNIVQIRVVLMPLLMAKDKGEIEMKDLKRVVCFLENFHFAYTAVMSGMANRLDSIYSKFAIAFRNCDTLLGRRETIDSMLIDKLKVLMPTLDQFREKFITMTYTKASTSANLKTKYAIKKLNAFYSGKEVFDDHESIEHIIPESKGGAALNIGNLIALETKINAKVGEEEYTNKRNIYSESEYPWVAEFIDKHENWSESDIPERAKTLAEFYYKKIISIV